MAQLLEPSLLALGLVRGAHLAYVALVIGGPLLLLAGTLGPARPLAHPALRLAHLAAVAFAAVQYATDLPCPLSVVDNLLSGRPAGAEFLPPIVVSTPAVVAWAAVALVAHLVAARRGRAAVAATREATP